MGTTLGRTLGTTLGRTQHAARSLVDRRTLERPVGPDAGQPSLGEGRTSPVTTAGDQPSVARESGSLQNDYTLTRRSIPDRRSDDLFVGVQVDEF